MVEGKYDAKKERSESLGESRIIGLGKAMDDISMNVACRQSLRDSIISRAYHAGESAREKERLDRLISLTDKHPETFELICLVRDLGLL